MKKTITKVALTISAVVASFASVTAQCITSVTLDNSTYKNELDINHLAIDHAIGSDNDRLLVVLVGTEHGTVDSVLMGSTKMTRITSVTNGMFNISSDAYYLLNPPSGNHTINLYRAKTEEISAAVYSFSGVDQTHPFRTVNTNKIDDANSENPVNETFRSSSGDYVIDILNGYYIYWDDLIPDVTQTILHEEVFTNRRLIFTHRTGADNEISMNYYVEGGFSMGSYIGLSVNCKMKVSVNDETTQRVICNNTPDTVVLGSSPTAFGGTPPYTFAWSPANSLDDATVANPKAFPTASTTYAVTVTDSTGDQNTGQFVVVRNDPPSNASAGNGATICENNKVQLQASGGSSYKWTPSNGLSDDEIADPTASPRSTTTYYVEVFNDLGCSSTDSVVINVNQAPPAYAGKDTTICENATINLKATGGTSYQWKADPTLSDPNIFNPSVSPVATTRYRVTVTDDIGCMDVDEIKVSVTIANAGEDKEVCEGKDVLIEASGGNTYQWSPTEGLNNPNGYWVYASPLQTTTYTLTVTGNTGCVSVDEMVVRVHPNPIVQVNDDVTLCTGGTVQLIASGGTEYRWWPPNGLSSWQIANPVASPSETTGYEVKVKTQYGCESKDSVYITVNTPTITATASPKSSLICGGEEVQLSVTTTGTSFSWTPATGLSCTDCSNPIASPNQTTTYKVEVDDVQSGCKVSDEVVVSVGNNPIAVNAGIDRVICKGQSTSLAASSSATNPVFSWTPSTGLSCTDCYGPTASPTVTTTYTVKVTEPNRCPGTDQIVVTVNECSGIDDGSDRWSGVEIYPNPGNGSFMILLPENIQISGLQVFDLMGRVIHEGQSGITGPGTVRLDLTAMPAGTYLLKMTHDEKVVHKKLVIE